MKKEKSFSKFFPRKNSLTIYEQMIPFSGIHYAVYWIIVGFIFFLMGESLRRYFNETQYIWTQLIFSVGAYGGWTIIVIETAKKLKNTFEALLSELLVLPDHIDSSSWINEKISRLFTLKNAGAKFSVAVFCFVGLGSIFYLGIPFNSVIVKIYSVIIILPVLAICGHGAYITLTWLAVFNEIMKLSVRPSFYRLKYPSIQALSSFFSFVAFGALAAYFMGVAAIWKGPYGISNLILILIAILGCFPLLIFTSAYFQLHQLMEHIKLAQISMVNTELQKAFEKIKIAPSKDNIEIVSGLMDIQQKIDKMSVWAIDISAVLTFTITFLTAILQIFLSIKEFIKP